MSLRNLEGEKRKLGYDLLLWATGASAPSLLRDSGLLTDEKGFLRVSATLQTLETPSIFAAGDCCAIEGHPNIPKAGAFPLFIFGTLLLLSHVSSDPSIRCVFCSARSYSCRKYLKIPQRANFAS